MLVCSICLSNEEDSAWRMPRCGHMFHDKCIQTWKASCKSEQNCIVCPQCRKPFRKLLAVFPQVEEAELESQSSQEVPGGGVAPGSFNSEHLAENLALLTQVSMLNASNNEIEEDLVKEKIAHEEAKVEIALKTHKLRAAMQELSEKEYILSKKERTIFWRDQELRSTRADILKYQKERMSRSKELAEARYSLACKTTEMKELKLSNEDLKQALNGKRAALKEKVKEAQRLKSEVKDVKGKLTDLKLRHSNSSTQPLRFGKTPLMFGKSSSWKWNPSKDLGLNSPIASRNALGNLSLNHNGISGISATQPLPRYDIDKPSVPRFGKSRAEPAFKSSFGESSSLTQPSGKSNTESTFKRSFRECSSMTQPSFLMTQKKRRRSPFSFGFGI